MHTSQSVSLLALCVFASVATAQQGGWLIKSSNIVSPSQPTTTVEVWARYDNPQMELAFAFGDFDFLAGDGLFSNAQVHLRNGNPSVNPGAISGNIVEGVFVGQAFGILGWFANTDNPILVWSADWRATDFTPRSVDLSTRNTTDFRVARINTGAQTQLYPQGFTPGTGASEVVPSPASGVPMVVVGAVMLRRRRRN